MRVRGAFANDVRPSGASPCLPRLARRSSGAGARRWRGSSPAGHRVLPHGKPRGALSVAVAQGAALTACAAIRMPAHGEGGWATPKRSLGPTRAFHDKPQNPMTLSGFFWCRRWRRNTTDGNQSISEITQRTTIERLGSTSLSADGRARSTLARNSQSCSRHPHHHCVIPATFAKDMPASTLRHYRVRLRRSRRLRYRIARLALLALPLALLLLAYVARH